MPSVVCDGVGNVNQIVHSEKHLQSDLYRLGIGGERLIVVDRLKVELDGLLDIFQRFLPRFAFANATRKAGNEGGKAAFVRRLKNNSEFHNVRFVEKFL